MACHDQEGPESGPTSPSRELEAHGAIALAGQLHRRGRQGARTRAAVRRSGADQGADILQTPAFRIDLAAKRVWRDSGEVRLTPTEAAQARTRPSRPRYFITEPGMGYRYVV